MIWFWCPPKTATCAVFWLLVLDPHPYGGRSKLQVLNHVKGGPEVPRRKEKHRKESERTAQTIRKTHRIMCCSICAAGGEGCSLLRGAAPAIFPVSTRKSLETASFRNCGQAVGPEFKSDTSSRFLSSALSAPQQAQWKAIARKPAFQN